MIPEKKQDAANNFALGNNTIGSSMVDLVPGFARHSLTKVLGVHCVWWR